ncbi:MAG: hypothetical protein HYV78_01465, partial [Candidatus Wildermuthbacteria bacterium]|nr:hypothetical protein [Candidatus Wildermuthbacteria bacterium]
MERVLILNVRNALLLRVISPALIHCEEQKRLDRFFQIRFRVTAGLLHGLAAISFEEVGDNNPYPPDFLFISSFGIQRRKDPKGTKTRACLNVSIQHPLPNSVSETGTCWLDDGDCHTTPFCRVQREGAIDIRTPDGRNTLLIRTYHDSVAPNELMAKYP